MNANAYAKINLGLHVVGKRKDGYHNIETIFHRINLFDQINIENSKDISISCTDPSIPTDDQNLCWKAVEMLGNELGIAGRARIEIKKNIPVGAGLGGGSSDAAAVLTMLPALWNVTVEKPVKEKLALRLGSDVPFFLQDTSAYAEGRGEILHPLDLELPYWIVLVYPNIHLSTPWAYDRLFKRRNGTFPSRQKLIDGFITSPLQTVLTSENDFEEIVFGEYAAIKLIKAQLKELGALHSLMSGSGSSIFGLFGEKESAAKAAEFFTKDYFVHLTDPYFTIS